MSRVFDVRDLARLWQRHAEQAGAAVLKIAVIVAAYLVVRWAVFRLIDRVFSVQLNADGRSAQARLARVGALRTVLHSAAGFGLGLVAAIMLLQAAGINIAPLIMSASVAGLAVGFGAQKLVRDVIAGFFILMEDQYGVGDYVTIGAVTGSVEELGMRITRVRDRSGKLYILSNGDIAQVCNHSRGALRASIDIAVPAATDLEKVKQVLDEVGRSMTEDMPSLVPEPFRCEGLAQVTGAAATLRIVGRVVPEHQETASMEFMARARSAFSENGLQFA